jgi:hypothetical protein
MAGEFMGRFYAPGGSSNALTQRNISGFQRPPGRKRRFACRRFAACVALAVASNGQKLHLFQMHRQIDKISRRDMNRVTNVCLVSLTTRYFLGYPYMKLNVALAASIAAFALMGCSKQEAAETAAPAADAAASSADAAASSADAAASSAAAATDAAAATPPADGAMAPAPAADAAAAPAAPAEAPKN